MHGFIEMNIAKIWDEALKEAVDTLNKIRSRGDDLRFQNGRCMIVDKHAFMPTTIGKIREVILAEENPVFEKEMASP